MRPYYKNPVIPLLIFLLFALTYTSTQAQSEERSITWTSIPDAPVPFGKAAGGVIDDYLYVFGGQPHTRLALAYSFTDGVWMQSTPSDNALMEAAYCVADGAIYRFSGIRGNNVAEKFVPDSSGGAWTTFALPPFEFRRPGSSCCWDTGNFIYANNSDKSNNPDGYFARYNITDNTWEMLSPPPHPRRYAGMASVNDLIYLIGGIGSNQRDPRICQVYDPADGSWGLIAPHPDPLNYTNSTVISDGANIWTVGHGGGYGIFPASAHVHYYDPANDTWNQETDLPVVRGLSLVGFHPTASTIIQAGGNVGNGNRFVSDGRITGVAPAGVLIGNVVDNWYSNPVFEVEVSVFDQNNNLMGVDTTDEYGFYAFALNPGTYSALYTRFSYLDSTITDIVINSNDTTEVNVILTFQHQCDYVVGDVNGSWSYNGLDITYAACFFKGAPAPINCLCECTPGDWWYVCCDVNGDCECNGLDIVYAVWYFKGGPPPTPCPDCPPINPVSIDSKEKPKKKSTASSSDRDSGSRSPRKYAPK
ncbi:MAG: carboxypeptidase regulatory-like domain-containing protein [Candidatus Zixiibacteriota bacterium]|nr:MAG: carboxypeptidase regulatory-like domain-containing protein [candidate division Zixibacteria bacterium]